MRTWGLVAVLVVAGIISALLWADLRPRQPNLPPYQYGERTGAEYQAGGAGCEPSALAAIRDNGEAARERKRCAEASEEHRLKREDLVQQSRAADAAQAQATTAYDLARMTLWGTIGGFLTLIAAGLAAYYARDAALASRDTVRAFVAVERPRLLLATGQIAQEGDTTWFTVFAENVGKTSAFVESVHYNVLDDRFPDRPFRNVAEVGVPVHITEKKKKILRVGSDVKRHKIPYLGGYVVYRSSFGERHKTYFCVRITPAGTYGPDVRIVKDKGWPEDT